jgi:hypothetical protein
VPEVKKDKPRPALGQAVESEYFFSIPVTTVDKVCGI